MLHKRNVELSCKLRLWRARSRNIRCMLTGDFSTFYLLTVKIRFSRARTFCQDHYQQSFYDCKRSLLSAACSVYLHTFVFGQNVVSNSLLDITQARRQPSDITHYTHKRTYKYIYNLLIYIHILYIYAWMYNMYYIYALFFRLVLSRLVISDLLLTLLLLFTMTNSSSTSHTPNNLTPYTWHACKLYLHAVMTPDGI